MTAVPPASVLRAFRAEGEPLPLAGGEGRTFAAGHTILKPVDDAAEASWCAAVYNDLAGPGFRVPRPVRARSGEWTVDGWAAWERVEGTSRPGRWQEAFAACTAFHEALCDLAPPAFLADRTHPWATGDRVAWEEQDIDLPEAVAPLAGALMAARRPIDGLSAQVIHGDMCGNMLFAEGLAPAVIDFSPYHRPAGLAAAILAFDALCWEGAGPPILSLLRGVEHLDQLLVRAAIFRLVAAAAAFRDRPDRLRAEVEGSEATVRLVLGRL